MRISFLLALMMVAGLGFLGSLRAQTRLPQSQDEYIQSLDELSALWSYYKHSYIQQGRVISHDEGGITTSEGQAYALLRAVWSGDSETFALVWHWTKTHLQVRAQDKLFAWKWKGKVLDLNAATDADTDIAMALVLASRHFHNDDYYNEALAIIQDIWNFEILHLGDDHYVTGGELGSGRKVSNPSRGLPCPLRLSIVCRCGWGASLGASCQIFI